MRPSFANIILTGVMFFFPGCSDAPHDNPLDPSSSKYRAASTVYGNVLVLNRDVPVNQARITSIETGISVLTDSAGNYQCSKLDAGIATLVCTKENFVPDTQRTTVDPSTARQVVFRLNGYPYVVSQKILTRKIDQYYPSPQYYVEVSATVSDPNGITDVDSVWFAVDTLRFTMEYSPTTKIFEATIFKYDFPTNTIQWLVGKSLTILSKDRSNARSFSSPFSVTRIIENGATPLSPTPFTSDTTGPTPLLKWSPPSVTFSYTYSISISRVDAGTQTVVWTHGGLNVTVEQLQFPGDNSGQTLQPGNYVWSVTVVDEFGNSSRSKEASFVVK